MSIRSYFLLSGIVLAMQFTRAQDDIKKWTLEECVFYAFENNITIQTSDLENDLANITERDAWGAFLPTANANANHIWNVGLTQNLLTNTFQTQTTQFTGMSMQSSVDLYRGLQNQNRLSRARINKLATTYRITKIKEDVALNVANAYLQIVFNKENLKIQQQQLSNVSLEFKRIQELTQEGILPQGELLNAQANVASAKQQLILAENVLYLSRLSLAQLLQLPNPGQFEIAEQEYPVVASEALLQTPEAIFEKAKQDRIEMKIASTDVSLAQKDIQIAKGAQMPSITGFYNFNTRISYADVPMLNPDGTLGFESAPGFISQFRDNRGHSFGLSLNIPVFNGFSVKNNVARSKIAFQRAKLNAKQNEIDLEQTIHTVFSDTQAALQAYNASLETVKARKEAYRYTQDRFAVGMSNAFELTQAQTLFIAAESEVIKAKYDYLFKVKILELYFGIPLY
jgi:outer membrane protein